MSTISPHRKPARSNGPRGHRLWCPRCDTDDHLAIESIQVLQPPKAGLVAAAYTCVNCGYFYSHTATVAQVTTVLNRPGEALEASDREAERASRPDALHVQSLRAAAAAALDRVDDVRRHLDGALAVPLRTVDDLTLVEPLSPVPGGEKPLEDVFPSGSRQSLAVVQSLIRRVLPHHMAPIDPRPQAGDMGGHRSHAR